MKLGESRSIVAYAVAAALLAMTLALNACGSDDGGGRTPTSSGGAAFVISPNHGYPDQQIVVSGCGFAANSPVDIDLSDFGDFATIETDADGKFRIDVQVPSLGPRTFVVKASTSETLFAEAAFKLERQGEGGSADASPTPLPPPDIASC